MNTTSLLLTLVVLVILICIIILFVRMQRSGKGFVFIRRKSVDKVTIRDYFSFGSSTEIDPCDRSEPIVIPPRKK